MEIELKDQSIPTYCPDNQSAATPPAAVLLPASFSTPDSSPSSVAASEFEGLEQHRRIFSDGDFQITGDDFGISREPLVRSLTGIREEMWTEAELQAALFDLDKLGSLEKDGDDGRCAGAASLVDDEGGDDGAGESEMWAVEPQRFWRIMANKQYAARTEERKTLELLELQQQIHCLQLEAQSFILQLTMYQRDMSRLSVENAQLEIRLKVMEEQHAHLRDALSEATMKQETERLKNSTEMMRRVPRESFGLEARGNMYSPLASPLTQLFPASPLLSPASLLTQLSPSSPLLSPASLLTQLSPASQLSPTPSLTQLSPASPLTQLSPASPWTQLSSAFQLHKKSVPMLTQLPASHSSLSRRRQFAYQAKRP